MWHYLRDWMNIVSSLVLSSNPGPKSSNFLSTHLTSARLYHAEITYIDFYILDTLVHFSWKSVGLAEFSNPYSLLKYSKVMHPKILKYNLSLTLLLIIRFKVKMKGMRNTLPGLDWYPCCQTVKRIAILHFITWSTAQAKVLKRLKCLSRLWSAKY